MKRNETILFSIAGLLLVVIIFQFFRMKIIGIVKPFKLRGIDKGGSGAFGAPRKHGTKKHKGLDIETKKGKNVYAPFDIYLERIANPYANEPNLSGAKYSHEKGTIKIFYFKPIKSKRTFLKGDIIGTVQSIQDKWSFNMKNHIHLEMRNKEGKLLNPEMYV